MKQPKIYYLYRHVRLDKNVPFYIGIGTIYQEYLNATAKSHRYMRSYTRNKRNVYWKRIVEKTAFRIDILFETSNIDLIQKKEKELIKLYGRKSDGGYLCNLTDGGMGIESYNHTLESKLKIGKASRNRKRKKGYKLKFTEDGLRKRREMWKTYEVSDETRRKYSANLMGNKRGLGHKVSEEQRENTRQRLYIPVLQMDVNGNIIKRFNSLKEAKSYGFDSKGINRQINGEYKTYKKCLWKKLKSKELDAGVENVEDQG